MTTAIEREIRNKEIIVLAKEGKTYKEIGLIMNLHEVHIYNICKKYGFKKYMNNNNGFTGFENFMLSGWKQNKKRTIKKANMNHTLTDNEYISITKLDCILSGLKPTPRSYKTKEIKYANSVDRIDSSKPYETDNCVPMNKTINKMKSDLDLNIFLKHVKDIYEHLELNKKSF